MPRSPSLGRVQRSRDVLVAPPHVRNRRGAIVVMTGIMIVALMLIGAVSVDASRIFAARNELQTAADAAALAGAVQLLDDSDGATYVARAYALRNRVESHLIDSVVVELGVWNVAADTFVVGGEPVDAVRVTVRHDLPLSLARILGDSTVRVTSSAVAWSSAPVSETSCAKPLAVPYSRLIEVLSPGQAWMNIDLTNEDIQRLRDMPIDDRTVELPYATSDDTTTGYASVDDDEYFPVDIDETWDPSDPSTHDRATISGENFLSYMVSRCSRPVSPGDEIRSEPGNKRAAIRDGIEQLCQLQGGVFNGWQCERDTGQGLERIDIPMKVLFWEDQPSVNPWVEGNPNRALLRVKMAGAFVFSELWDTDQDGTPMEGTLFGYFDVVRDYGPVDPVAASTVLRPVLVR